MKDRVLGIETEYALIYHPGRADRERPTKLALYRRFESALRERVRSLPNAFSPLRAKGGRFLENGATFHYEATAEEYEQGLLEMASPECRDPYTLIHFERAKDELVEELAHEVNRELEVAGYTGRVRIGKNNVDSQGHTFGSHESYWVEDRLPLAAMLAVVPLWIALWAVSLPVLAFVLGIQIAIVFTVLIFVALLLAGGLILSAMRRSAAQPLFRWVERQAERLESHPGDMAARAQRLVAPIYPLMKLHSAVYNRFYFRRFRSCLAAFLVTRTLYSGAGAVVFDGGPLLRLAQRPPFLRTLSRIFPEGEERPVFEMRDLFFRPWSVFRSRRRLHLLSGDANLCEWAQVLRVGTTALVLEAIECGVPWAWPVLKNPLAALNRLNRDTKLEVELELSDGSHATALEIQRRYLDGVRRALAGRATLDVWKARVLRDWEETLDLLEHEPDALEDRIDWLAKRRLLFDEVPDPEDREALRLKGAELIRDGEVRIGIGLRLRDLAYRAWRVDLRYHELGPRGGYRRLEQSGRVRRLSDPAKVEQARVRPPDDTRAWARGQAIKWAHAHALSGAAAWHRVRLGKLGWRWFTDPLDPQR
jgi:proteasome accessory factor A